MERSSKLKLRHLELRAVTSDGLFNVHIPFEDGLFVVHADNSKGKSTCAQGIIYALGMEQMLSASGAVPLPHAMTHSVQDDDGAIFSVVESSVLLEIENRQGAVLTIQRSAVNPAERKSLVKTWQGPALSDPAGTYERRDYFVNIEGAAQRPDGFHHMLAEFIGWGMPLVARHQGGPVPLYLECIFPLLIVEQKRGWSGLQGQMPTHFGIRETYKRAVEFLLGLEEHGNALARQSIEQESIGVKNEWTKAHEMLVNSLRSVGAIVVDLSPQPVADWPPPTPANMLIVEGNSSKSLSQTLTEIESSLRRLEQEEIPKVEQVADELTASLASKRSELSRLELLAEQLAEEADLEAAQIAATEDRLSALQEDLQRNKDTRRLRELGSILKLSTSSDVCPTCHQPIKDTLIDGGSAPMSIDDNIGFVSEQIQTFSSMRADASRVLKMKERHLESLTRRVSELRADIRTTKRALVSQGDAPSEAAIRHRMQLEGRVAQLRRASSVAESTVAQFGELSRRWRDILARSKRLSSAGLSKTDEEKLAALEALFKEQLKDYGFSSIAPSSLRVSRHSYRPEHEGFDLGFDLSASDLIRAIWAYLFGMVELAREVPTNHPGLLILDEPRQQSTNRVSFADFLGRAASAGKFAQQVIIFTSEDIGILRDTLSGLPHRLKSYSGFMLRRASGVSLGEEATTGRHE